MLQACASVSASITVARPVSRSGGCLKIGIGMLIVIILHQT
jgi:hypothetical protein